MHALATSTLVVLLAAPHLARADYAPGEVPEGMNAYTARAGAVHLSVLGTSSVGITDDTELATYLLADAVLFPNLRLEHRFVRDPQLAISGMIGAGAGLYPFAAGAALPLPGGVVAGGGVGVAYGAIETATLLGSLRVAPNSTLSVNGGGFAVEGGIAGLIGGVGAGGGGAGAGGGAASASGRRLGGTGGIELTRTFGAHDALVVACDGWWFPRFTAGGQDGLIYPRATWTHAWQHLHLTGGAYALLDPPNWTAVKASRIPVAPFVNVAWNWDRR